MSVDILGTSCDQCRSTVQQIFTSTETRRLVRTDSPGRPPRLSHSSWTMHGQTGSHFTLLWPVVFKWHRGSKPDSQPRDRVRLVNFATVLETVSAETTVSRNIPGQNRSTTWLIVGEHDITSLFTWLAIKPWNLGTVSVWQRQQRRYTQLCLSCGWESGVSPTWSWPWCVSQKWEDVAKLQDWFTTSFFWRKVLETDAQECVTLHQKYYSQV